MANNIGGSINQLFRTSTAGNVTKTGKPDPKAKLSSKIKDDSKVQKSDNPFGASAKMELSPEVEMYGRVVDLLQKKYDNADVFVAGPGEDLSQIGGDLEYSIILSEDEMKLLASDDPKDKEAKDKLMGQIDDAMKTISDMSEKIGSNTDENDEISAFGLKMNKNGKFDFFADINGNSFKADSIDNLIKSFTTSKA